MPADKQGLSVDINTSDIVGGDAVKKVDPAKGLAPKVDAAKIVAATPNFVKTNNPDVYMGRNGVPITKEQFNKAQKSSMPFTSFESYADYVGGWAHPDKPIPELHPYYRTYPAGQISGLDVFRLYQMHDPKVDEILSRQSSAPGEVPMFGAQDSDNLRMLIAKTQKTQ